MSKPGCVYLPKLPPYISKELIIAHFEDIGPLGRVFLRPEPEAQRTERIKRGGRPTIKYKDGWIEFLSKKDAKKAADFFDNQPLGGRSAFRDHILHVRYLHKFVWEDLSGYRFMKEINRKKKLKAELEEITKKNQHYLEQLTDSKKT